ncbi:NYN domain-containing protein [Lentilactobacillus senioris]|uniref:YacP-like NYN domain-containing protein n=1 Tax=Lentilactobacillus senioris TaxID=931534 RepID=UPI0022820F82|nr:NYN domain-containing protein [Lentilactobacillus senioris]MCY9807144.1 NYN domain-containing protein [Lentilactobacillus senioris]
MKEDLLIVDAYNMIGNWPELNKLKLSGRLEEARDQLLFTLSQYKKYRDLNMIVVFDAMYVPGNAKSFRQYDMEIIWTSKDQTADSYIEALARQKQSRFVQVTVATSDQAEQWTVFSAGALRIPARELLSDVKRAEREVNQEAKVIADRGQIFRRSPFTANQLLSLEKLRDELSHRGHK